ncbi:hypothetical protein [Streptomyces subrutilus]|uniref:MarR family transcriptional regulator n=1 Tax=Streptomyces subrutilus TaxID=36818 RepID=A0A1E5NXM1_9ACTN|nr:hypothetical protein [Streptomyces subrutilus]OEJ21008.1 hypothetical protein BGK67_34495 [Streptomyces subrutilus]
MNPTQQTVLDPALATDISDRAFRLYTVLVLRTSGEWTAIPSLAAALGLTPHQVRFPLSELRASAMVETNRVYETGEHDRKTWHTYVRLPEDTTSVFDTDHASEAVA